ncbi:hypothetical protein JWG44_18390 [Leptospira sp. 201903071]|uniref:ankyrin repeat domain-containing protein n=1 Tax=Leptospira ainazelensis TaxID=2810034 RepID=UPI00196638DD|nr:ankyrin repeat domain-containing protein [Leptospira ainazelensis]MBM9502228.1 hypothetical protein [Leptospira ainazelensis]
MRKRTSNQNHSFKIQPYIGRIWARSLYQLFLILSLCFLIACSASVSELIQRGENQKVIAVLEKESGWNKSNECEPPLSTAARFGNMELLKILLSKGADPNFRAKGCAQESALILEGVLISKDRFFTATHTPLSQAVNSEVAKILIAAGANPNFGGYRQNDPSGKGLSFYQSPLYVAILNRKYDLAKYLIQRGASIEIYNPLTGENELELWFTSVGVRSKKDQEFFQFLKSKGLNRIPSSPLKLSEGDNRVLSFIHLPTQKESKVSILTLRENGSLENDLIYFEPEKKYFHSSEFVWKDSGKNLYDWILQRRLYLKQK